MDVPDLGRVVEAYVLVTPDEILPVLRRIILPSIRDLEHARRIRWWCVLVHQLNDITGQEADRGRLAFHLRLEPSEALAPDQLVAVLPPAFQGAHQVPLGEIAGLALVQLRNQDWAHAWRVLGEASEWALRLVENHEDALSAPQIIQFLHFITNPLGLGMQSVWLPGEKQF